MKRRDFFRDAALGGLGLALFGSATGISAQDDEKVAPGESLKRPLAIASANGLRATERAVHCLRAGTDPLDAAVAGVKLIEDDPDDITVGLGGIPNEDGVVQLDASVMHGPTHQAGAVAALERIKNPSRVAQLVLGRTDRVFLVGEGALRFARAHGLSEENLLTERARKIWLHWRESHSDRDDWLPPEELDPVVREYLHGGGTVHCSARTPKGDFGAVTSTSGLFFKMPGRVGDSPLIGAGLYVDNEVGSAGATGRGEAVIASCGSHAVVHEMGRGASPEEACLRVLEHIVDLTRRQGRRLDEKRRPAFNVVFYALDKKGRHGSAALWSGRRYALSDGLEDRLLECAFLFQ